MAFKIAIASHAGLHVDQHFGKAELFLVYRWHVDEWVSEEPFRTAAFSSGGSHDEATVERAPEPFKEFRVVLALAAGPRIVQAFRQAGIDLLCTDEAIDTVLSKIASSPLYRKDLFI